MTDATKLIAGLLLIVMTTIEYGGTFLFGVLSGKYAGFTEFQRSMFRAGHAHAGVLTILALVALLFTTRQGFPRQSDGRYELDSRRFLFW